ncbi:flagellar hook assembly protein FlgD [Nisaea sp.]|uniref:flagellar hook assembly protein FlgD n=1 Tax=Nisaea sp. TaxID=2024842 RepID=UPI003B523E46
MVSAVSSSGDASIFATEQTTEERLEEQRDQFLTLFLTQLQNQDPTSPMDSNEMTNQLVQFTSVEQQIETNKSLGKLVEAQVANSNTAAVGYIDQTVVFNGNTTTLTEEGAAWGYKVDQNADSVAINVFNESGLLVYTTEGNTTPDTRHEFKWDGKNNAGEQMPNGTYSVRIGALDKNDDTVDTQIESLGRVTGVVTGENGPSLLVGNVVVEMDTVTRVSAT